MAINQDALNAAAQLYSQNLGRAGDEEGINYWAGRIANGEDVSSAFRDSARTVYENFTATGDNPYANLLRSDYADPTVIGSGDASLTQGALNKTPSTFVYGQAQAPAPAAPNLLAKPYQDISAMSVDPMSAWAGLGAANPMNSVSKLLSGQVNTETLDPVVANAQRRLGENFNEQVMPAINQGAIGAGQYGSSRQGIAQGLAAKGLAYAQGDLSANMYNQAYQQAQQNMYGTANNMANLGLTNAQANANRDLAAQTSNASNALSKYGMDQGFYNAQRGLDLNQTQLGANLLNQANAGLMNQGQGIYNLGGTFQNAPWTTISNMNSAMTPYTGFGSSSMTQQGSTAGGVLGGGLMGAQLYKNLGFGGSVSGAGTMSNAPMYGDMYRTGFE